MRNTAKTGVSVMAAVIGLGLMSTSYVAADLIWIEWPVGEGGNGHLYALTESWMTFAEAETIAVNEGGHLATVNDAAENQWLFTSFGDGLQGLWIGFTDSEDFGTTEGSWIWVSGETDSYTNWAPGEPNNNQNEDWAILYGSAGASPGHWNDIPLIPGSYLEPGIIEIPEPGSSALLIMGVALALRSRR